VLHSGDQTTQDFFDRQFIKSKHKTLVSSGFEAKNINPLLKPWQADLVRWFCRLGQGGGFEATGLGKTFQQLVVGEQIVRYVGGKVLIVCPLAVAKQTKRESEKFQIEVDVTVCREPSDVRPGINVTNYERIYKFDPSAFVCVICDESSIMKSFTGTTKRALCSMFSRTPYRYVFSATPAPNDYLEMGNQCEFLGVMRSNEMIARWFANNTMQAGGYSLKPHGAKDYWRWVSSWAACVSMPSDLGYPDDEYVLPPLNKIIHEISCDNCKPSTGMLFHAEEVSATNLHKIKRATAKNRAEKVADIIGSDDEPWIVWCDSNYEADELKRLLLNAIEVRGSDSMDKKEDALISFSNGTIKQLITKPEIAGHGLNWQHCHKMAFVGLNFSFERPYQAVRRCWRFGQTKPVEVHIVTTDAEGGMLSTVSRKEEAFETMRRELQDAVKEGQLESIYGKRKLNEYRPKHAIQTPAWLATKEMVVA
jgi:hypothetical protein